MLAFGLGTIPAMVITGCGGSMITVRAQARVYRVAAAVVVVIVAMTIYRGWPRENGEVCCSGVPASAFDEEFQR